LSLSKVLVQVPSVPCSLDFLSCSFSKRFSKPLPALIAVIGVFSGNYFWERSASSISSSLIADVTCLSNWRLSANWA